MKRVEKSDIETMVQAILKDDSAYGDLKSELLSIQDEDKSVLLSILRDENPPLLGTGPVQ
jgi:hypothetical protein